MKQVIRNIGTKAQADKIAVEAKVAWFKNRGTKIPSQDVHKYIGMRDMITVDDDQNVGKMALVDPFDASGGRDTIEDIARHNGTRAALKTKMATREEYTEAMADELEPRRLPSEDRDTPGEKYTREEERMAMVRVPADTPEQQKRQALRDAVKQVILER